MTGRARAAPSTIALVKLSSLGDVIHALPVARAVRRAWPAARLVWIAEVREARLLRAHPDLDEVITVDTRRWRRVLRRPRSLPAVCAEVGRLRAELRALGADVAVDLQGLIKSGIVAWLTRAPLRIGLVADRCRERANAWFTNLRVRPSAAARHVVEQCLALVAPLGIPPAHPEFHLPTRASAEVPIDAFLAGQGIAPGQRLVVLNPGAGRPDKCWPIAHFAELASGLAPRPGVRIVVAWGPGEQERARAVASRASPPAALAPGTDLDELAVLLRRAVLVVGGDTGPIHLAAALGTPTLGLFGPTRAERNGPYGAHCRSLQSADGTMAGLEPPAVLDAAQGLLR